MSGKLVAEIRFTLLLLCFVSDTLQPLEQTTFASQFRAGVGKKKFFLLLPNPEKWCHKLEFGHNVLFTILKAHKTGQL